MKSSDTYKVIELENFGGRFRQSTRNFKTLNKEEILVKIVYATIHPSDQMFVTKENLYTARPNAPVVPGFEGCGEIVKVGEGAEGSLVGKRCTVMSYFHLLKGEFQGVWAQYFITNPKYTLVHDKAIPYEKICFSLVNPLTCCGFLDTLRKKNQTSLILNGASSALGKMSIKLFKKEGVDIVAVVRNKKHFEELKSLGASEVLSTEDSNWTDQLKEISKKKNITTYFDCVSGDHTAKALRALPDDSVIYNFGNFEMKAMNGITSQEILVQNKALKGWTFTRWLMSLGEEELKKWFDYIGSDILKGSKLFSTKVSKEFNMEQFEEAKKYYEENMSEGKVLIKFN